MPKTQILLVEDSDTDAFLVQEALREHGIAAEVRVIADGALARRLIEEQETCPDLVILDLNLPKVDGLSLLRLMRERGWCHQTQVAVLTSSQAERDRREALALGARRFLHKSSTLDEFLAVGSVFKELLQSQGNGSHG